MKKLVILIMLMCMIVGMITYWIYAYYSKYNEFYWRNINLVSYTIDNYVNVEGDKIHLKNVDENIIANFIKSQDKIINDNNVSLNTSFIYNHKSDYIRIKKEIDKMVK